MALVAAPSTPASQISRRVVSTPSPGTWRHPQFDKIAQRQAAATFSSSNVQKIIWNGGALAILWVFRGLVESYPDVRNAVIPLAVQEYTYTLLGILSLLSIFNIAVSCYPLVMKKDNLTDIDLTPSQRALLGLDPNAGPPATPATQYITPPRYPRSSTPQNDSPGSWSGSNADSPLSRQGSPSLGRQGSESPFSPSAIPMWQKAVGGTRDTGRRHSYGSPSPLGLGRGGKDSSVLGVPSTPSPPTGRGSSVGLNNRWLYERGRVSPGSRMPKIYA